MPEKYGRERKVCQPTLLSPTYTLIYISFKNVIKKISYNNLYYEDLGWSVCRQFMFTKIQISSMCC